MPSRTTAPTTNRCISIAEIAVPRAPAGSPGQAGDSERARAPPNPPAGLRPPGRRDWRARLAGPSPALTRGYRCALDLKAGHLLHLREAICHLSAVVRSQVG